MKLMKSIINKAKKLDKKIVLPEGLEVRTLKAANIILKKKIAQIILIGNSKEILSKAKKLHLDYIKKAEIVDPEDHPRKLEYANLLFLIRKEKGITREKAEDLVSNPLYLAALMIKAGHADGEVAGAQNTTGDVLRPALQIVKTKPGINIVSGAFIMQMNKKKWGEKGIMVFADCAVHPAPTAEDLAEIAICTDVTTRSIVGIEPRIAMLAFSTKGSAQHKRVDKVVKATELAIEMNPNSDS